MGEYADYAIEHEIEQMMDCPFESRRNYAPKARKKKTITKAQTRKEKLEIEKLNQILGLTETKEIK